MLHLVLFGIEVLLASPFARSVHESLEGRTVDAVACGQRRRKHEANEKRRTSAILQILGENVGSVRPCVRPEEFAHRWPGDLVEVLGQLVLGVAPGEVSVRLAEAGLASQYMILGRVKASARNSTSGCSFRISRMTHCQKGSGFVCGLSTRKMRTPLSIQKRKTPPSSCQSACHFSLSKSNG